MKETPDVSRAATHSMPAADIPIDNLHGVARGSARE